MEIWRQATRTHKTCEFRRTPNFSFFFLLLFFNAGSKVLTFNKSTFQQLCRKHSPRDHIAAAFKVNSEWRTLLWGANLKESELLRTVCVLQSNNNKKKPQHRNKRGMRRHHAQINHSEKNNHQSSGSFSPQQKKTSTKTCGSAEIGAQIPRRAKQSGAACSA